MIKVTNELHIYADHGDKSAYPHKKLTVMSHWNEHDKITLLYEGMEITVVGKDLLAAIANAQNTARW